MSNESYLKTPSNRTQNHRVRNRGNPQNFQRPQGYEGRFWRTQTQTWHFEEANASELKPPARPKQHYGETKLAEQFTDLSEGQSQDKKTPLPKNFKVVMEGQVLLNTVSEIRQNARYATASKLQAPDASNLKSPIWIKLA